ncbi:MAG: TonB-dependent receptor [Bryobacterales bacterium]|nr:TonB-dependent receptor [Bryobacterales bacterium]
MRLSLRVTVLSLLLAVSAQPQNRGTISGYVRDTTGGMITAVKVTLTNERTGATRSANSDLTGAYQFLGLISGTYTIEAENSGFKRFRNTGVILEVDENVRADVTLEVGALTESVSVTAEASLVDTRSSETSAILDGKRLMDLPVNGRNVFRLASTLPGVLGVSAPDNTDLGDTRAGPRMNVNGARPNMNYNRFNGTYFNNPSRNTGLNAPPPDAVQEFKIQTSNFSAESGRNPGANITIVSRQGTNEFHGAVWEFHRNDNLNARSFFQTFRPQLIQNQFGGAAGGPIKRNKLFVFGTYEMLRDRRQAATTNAFPITRREAAGDFSALLPGKQLVNPADNTPFPNNQIPTSLFDPAARKLLEFVPVVESGSVQAVGPNPRNSELFMVRTDYVLTSKQTLFGHYYLNQNSISNPVLGFSSTLAGWAGQTQRPRFQNAGINHTWTVTPNILNQITLGYTRSFSLNDPSVTRLPPELNIPALPVYTDGGSPQFQVSGRFNLNSGGPVKFISNTYQFQENLSWIKGRHTMKFGFEYMDLGFFQSFLGPPVFAFNGQRTGGGNASRGDSMADFVLGAYQSLGITNGVRVNDGASTFTSFYAQDDFKVNRKLTLNLGLRYEIPTPWVDKYDRINTVFPVNGLKSGKFPTAPTGMLFPGDLPRGLMPTDKNNLAPRIGFAYDVFGDGKTALRGAYGIFYDTFNTDTVAQENPPFVGGRRTFFNGQMANPFTSVGATAPPAFIDPAAFSFVYPINGLWSATTSNGLRTTYMQEFNFTISRQLAREYAVNISYIGKTGTKLIAYRPFNAAPYIPGNNAQGQPRSTEGNAGDRVPFQPGIYGPEGYYLDNAFTSAYHSLQLEVNKRFSRGFLLNSSYVLSKALDSSSTYTLGGCVANPFNVRDGRGRADWDRRHNVVISGVYSPPVYRQQKGFLGRALGGWNFSGISIIQSGLPVTVVNGQNRAYDGTGCSGSHLADIAGSVYTRDQTSRADMINQFFNISAFRLPAIGTYGNSPRGAFSGPANVNTDFAILKDIAVNETMRFQLRGEFFNIFNQVNFSNPISTLANPRFGQITGSAAGRSVQLGFKFLW